MELRQILTDSLTDTIIEIFSSALATVPLVKEKKFELTGSSSDIISSLGLAGKLEGALVLLLTEEAARNIVFKMFEMSAEEAASEILDGVGELTNIIAGGLKTRLVSVSGHSFDLSLPTVVKGNCPMSVVRAEKSDSVELEVQCAGIIFGVRCYYSLRGETSTGKDFASMYKRRDSRDAAGELKQSIKEK
jgi:CheY-specific phosphatase CheX